LTPAPSPGRRAGAFHPGRELKKLCARVSEARLQRNTLLQATAHKTLCVYMWGVYTHICGRGGLKYVFTYPLCTNSLNWSPCRAWDPGDGELRTASTGSHKPLAKSNVTSCSPQSIPKFTRIYSLKNPKARRQAHRRPVAAERRSQPAQKGHSRPSARARFSPKS